MANAGFDTLSLSFADRFSTVPPEAGASTIVVCPSLTFPVAELRKIAGIQYYEERLLFVTFLLQRPDLEIIYPTSLPIDDAILEYYLGWLQDPAGARARLNLIPIGDPDPRPLTEKLLRRPDAIAAIKDGVRHPETSFILPFNVTPAEAQLAEALGVPLYGPSPDLFALGSKSGSRRIAVEAGVDVLPGESDLYSLKEVEAAVSHLRHARPNAEAVVAKLNNGFSGQGNVVLPLKHFSTPIESMPATFCAAEETWASFGPKVEREGAIAEELARGPGVVSPSVQLRILPGGACEVVSTHDQILGGPDGQVYLGCRFPARSDYRENIQQLGMRVGRELASAGVIGSFGIDFVVVPDRGIYLSEINLRLGGTTHPFLMSRYITGGDYDASSGRLLVGGEERVYTASDNLKSPLYSSLSPARVIEAVAAAGLAFDPASATGATLHLLGALPTYGKLGTVCIGRTPEEADALYADVVARLEALARP